MKQGYMVFIALALFALVMVVYYNSKKSMGYKSFLGAPGCQRRSVSGCQDCKLDELYGEMHDIGSGKVHKQCFSCTGLTLGDAVTFGTTHGVSVIDDCRQCSGTPITAIPRGPGGVPTKYCVTGPV